jgi:xylulokinase
MPHHAAGAQMTRAYYLGIDAGTSGLKALVVDGHGNAVAQGLASYALRTARPGWVEGDPEEWWSALCAATRQALATAGIGGAQIAAAGFSGQMHTLVLLDAAARPVRPAISWADARGASERAEIEARVGRARLIAITGSPAVSAFTATKLLWVRRHEPEVWVRARLALLPKDYLRLRLTGVAATDPTDAGATGLLDLQARDWSPAVLAALELPRALLPRIAPSADRAGTVSPAGRAAGLAAGTPVATGAGDQECAALGCGITAPGTLLITLGSGGQVFAATTTPLTDPHGRLHTLPHALPDRWHVLAAIPAAGLAIAWLRGLIPVAAQAPARPSTAPPIFVPSVAGERTPSMDEGARAMFFGLTLAHTAGDVLFAAREGVCFALRACVDVLRELGILDDAIAVTGGLSADAGFLALLANVLGRPLRAAAHREGSAYGAALLAAHMVGALPLPAGPLLAGAVVHPNAEQVAWHAQRYEIYRRLASSIQLMADR